MAVEIEELKDFLKENLKIDISHAKHDVGYYSSYIEDDPNNFTVSIYLGDELITESTSN